MLTAVTQLWSRTFDRPRQPSSGWWRLARRIRGDAERLAARSEAELLAASLDLRFRARCGEPLSRLLRPAFALMCESARRHIGLRPYEVQILGGIALHQGTIAEMQTGEGKTLTATLPLFLHALSGKAVHLATANDYLAARDAEWMRPAYEALGMRVGAVTGELTPATRRAAYECDITYGTAREFGFDFLRDQLTRRARRDEGLASGQTGEASLFARAADRDGRTSEPGQRSASGSARLLRTGLLQRHPLSFALIDEADSLLIDEARTPLIISSQAGDLETRATLFRWAADVAPQFQDGVHLDHDTPTGRFDIRPDGLYLLRQLVKPAALSSLPLGELADTVMQAVRVAATLQRDRQYVVRDGQIQIVDEFTGRIAEGRKWRDGVHQAVEAREAVAISPETRHCARITMQELVAQYECVAGMTGTAASATSEFRSIYNLTVTRLPTRIPPRRSTLPPQVFLTADERCDAIVAEVRTMLAAGRPVLIGTRTIEQSEQLAQRLREARIEAHVLNARHHAREAEIVAQAGQPGQVTVATNMAGRGTDIALHDDARARGGLHVICSEPHSSQRIDLQLAGRCARQGDPGSFRQFFSLDDELLQTGLGAGFVEDLRAQPGSSTSLSRLAGLFGTAQRQLEQKHAEERRLLTNHSQALARQLRDLGQDPWLDAV